MPVTVRSGPRFGRGCRKPPAHRRAKGDRQAQSSQDRSAGLRRRIVARYDAQPTRHGPGQCAGARRLPGAKGNRPSSMSSSTSSPRTSGRLRPGDGRGQSSRPVGKRAPPRMDLAVSEACAPSRANRSPHLVSPDAAQVPDACNPTLTSLGAANRAPVCPERRRAGHMPGSAISEPSHRITSRPTIPSYRDIRRWRYGRLPLPTGL
jgi:hypothetical protein